MPVLDEQKRKQMLWWIFFGLLLVSAYVLYPFLLALFVGTTFALALEPWQNAMLRRFRLKPALAASVMVLLFMLFILGPLTFVVVKGLSYLMENPEFIAKVGVLEKTLVQKLTSLSQNLSLPIESGTIEKSFASLSGSLQREGSAFAREAITSMPDYILQFLVMLMTLFVVLAQHKKILSGILNFTALPRRRVQQIHDILCEVCHDVVIANIITGAIQAAMVTAGAIFLTGVDPVLVFVVTFVVSFIPLIGAAPVAILLSFYEFAQKSPGAGITLLVLSAVVGISDNILRAKLLSARKQGSSFLNMIACFGGIYIWGLIGLFVAPVIVSFTSRVAPLLLIEIKKSSLRAKYLESIRTRPPARAGGLAPLGTGHGSA